MPVPKEGETRDKFISRCIPYVIHEGTTDDPKQAAAICYSIWRKHHPGAKSEDEDKAYNCECIECGYTMESEEHCKDITCPECGGEMRRAERPGVGKSEDIYLPKLGDIKLNLPKFELVLRPIIENKVEEIEEINKLDSISVPFDLRGNIKIIEKSDNKRVIAGYANIAVVDLEDQFIPIETLKKGIESLLKDPHYSNLMLVHKNIQIGKIIPKFGELTTHVDDKGLFIVAEIRRDIKTADEVWESILNKDINGFSIGCEVLEHHEECDDNKCITVLDEINIFEVSVCTHPVNKQSGFIVVSKSSDYVCDECYINNDIMTKTKDKTKTDSKKSEETEEDIIEESVEEPQKEVKEEKQEEDEEEKTEEETKEEEPSEEPEEKSIEERLDILERAISTISSAIEEITTKQDEEEMPEEELPEEEPEEEVVEESEEKEEEELSEEEKTEEKTEPYEELFKSINTLLEKLSEKSDIEELKLAIKSRDDKISELEERVKVINKSSKKEEKVDKGKPKTLQSETEPELEEDNPIRVENGMVYYKE